MAKNALILAGDIGGTKTHLALFARRGDKLESCLHNTFPSQEYSGLEPVLRAFLDGTGYAIERACFGVAGPLVDGKVKPPNLSWTIDPEPIAATLRLSSVSLLNDLQAAAYGIFTLEPEEFLILNEGVVRPGNKALIAAGTGLGETILHGAGRSYRPIASEGGHADFAARDELEVELWRYLNGKFGHVSYERVLSGPGLFNIYSFLRDAGIVAEPAWFAEKIAAADDASALVSASGMAGAPEIAVKALDMFVSAYGAEAGNLALRGKTVGGAYVGGGIAPKIIDKLKDGTFVRAFFDKGRYLELVSSIPVYVILNDQAALRGAAYYGAFEADG